MNREIIVKMRFGSHLYGTNTIDSDEDFKGVFLPSKEDILLNKIPKQFSESTGNNDSKNTKDDIDSELYSLHYFIQLAVEGQTVALDMLHAPDNMIIEKSDIWDEIVKNKHLFYTKNLNAFVGYARKQAAKYGIKGSRLNDAKKVLDFLKASNRFNKYRLMDKWNYLPEGEHIFKHEDVTPRMYEVCGRKLQDTVTIDYAIDAIKLFYDKYGERARQAAENKGVDFKAVSHALRAAYQVREILINSNITFPLKQAAFLTDVKQGKLHYQKDVAPLLDNLMDQIEELAKESTLPKKVNRKFWDEFIIDIVDSNV